MGIAEEYVRMEGWARVVEAAGLGCDGRPGTVYELATLIMNDSEVERLQQAAFNPAKEQERMDAKLDAIFHDKPLSAEPFESDLVGVLLSMPPEQREAMQARVVALYQQKKVVDL